MNNPPGDKNYRVPSFLLNDTRGEWRPWEPGKKSHLGIVTRNCFAGRMVQGFRGALVQGYHLQEGSDPRVDILILSVPTRPAQKNIDAVCIDHRYAIGKIFYDCMTNELC